LLFRNAAHLEQATDFLCKARRAGLGDPRTEPQSTEAVGWFRPAENEE
jgi:hypothetical protein